MIAFLALLPEANAFCGTYVGGPGSELYANVSEVAIWRQNDRTVLSIANDVTGDFDDFAMIVPVPHVIPEEDVHVLDPELFGRLEAYSQPRLVSYECEDFVPSYDDTAWDAANDTGSEADTGVVVEDHYIVGEYEIVILSSSDSQDLLGWLVRNEYEVSLTAEEMLQDYIDSGSMFLAAKVAADAGIEDGDVLSPLQFAYTSEAFGLPVRLGTLNSSGTQDLVIYALNRFDDGKVSIANYSQAALEDECLWESSGESFGSYYNRRFEQAYESVAGAAWVEEYSWGGSGCDPCAGNPPDYDDMLALGMPGEDRTVQDMYFTRIHMRYTPEEVASDLVLYQSGIDEQSQIRFITYEPYLEDRFPHCELGQIDDPGSCDELVDDPDSEGGSFRPVVEACSGCTGAPAGMAWVLGLLGALMVRRRR